MAKKKSDNKELINYEYGEMDSMEELNAKADELKAAGDSEGVVRLAKENGIDEDLADMYIQGKHWCVTPSSSAYLKTVPAHISWRSVKSITESRLN